MKFGADCRDMRPAVCQLRHKLTTELMQRAPKTYGRISVYLGVPLVWLNPVLVLTKRASRDSNGPSTIRTKRNRGLVVDVGESLRVGE